VNKPKSATPSISAINLIGTILRFILLPSSMIRKKIMNLGELASYQIWLKNNFGNVRIRNSRERVWDDLGSSLLGEKIQGIELGVAWGYLTYYWFTNGKPEIVSWDAYDLFTGLPRAWRSSPEGSFSNGGKTPDLHDPRIRWHVGFVEETIQELQIAKNREFALAIFFDLDIFEPSHVAWEKIKPFLRAGDILYFDEAFDVDERGLLDNFVLPAGEFEFVSANWISLGLKVVRLH
jgi:hypothetical protein